MCVSFFVFFAFLRYVVAPPSRYIVSILQGIGGDAWSKFATDTGEEVRQSCSVVSTPSGPLLSSAVEAEYNLWSRSLQVWTVLFSRGRSFSCSSAIDTTEVSPVAGRVDEASRDSKAHKTAAMAISDALKETK